MEGNMQTNLIRLTPQMHTFLKLLKKRRGTKSLSEAVEALARETEPELLSLAMKIADLEGTAMLTESQRGTP